MPVCLLRKSTIPFRAENWSNLYCQYIHWMRDLPVFEDVAIWGFLVLYFDTVLGYWLWVGAYRVADAYE